MVGGLFAAKNGKLIQDRFAGLGVDANAVSLPLTSTRRVGQFRQPVMLVVPRSTSFTVMLIVAHPLPMHSP